MSNTAIQEAVKQGIMEGMKAMTQDKELMSSFWKSGYEELVKHSSNGASQWIGKRLLTAFMGALLVWVLTWYVNHGAKP